MYLATIKLSDAGEISNSDGLCVLCFVTFRRTSGRATVGNKMFD